MRGLLMGVVASTVGLALGVGCGSSAPRPAATPAKAVSRPAHRASAADDRPIVLTASDVDYITVPFPSVGGLYVGRPCTPREQAEVEAQELRKSHGKPGDFTPGCSIL